MARIFKFGLLCTSLLLCGGLVFVCFAPELQQSFSTSQNFGAIQVLGGPEELWCFVQIDRVVYNPDPIASPTNYALGHFQEVLVVSETGKVSRIPISIPEGVTFHPNISSILRVDDDFYLYQGFSMNTHRSVYKWETDHFRLLPLGESEAFLRDHSLSDVDPADDAIDQIPLSADWKRVFHDAYLYESAFEWNGGRYELECAVSDDNETASLNLLRVDDEPWTVELVTWDPTSKPITREEMDAISDRQQRGHQR